MEQEWFYIQEVRLGSTGFIGMIIGKSHTVAKCVSADSSNIRHGGTNLRGEVKQTN